MILHNALIIALIIFAGHAMTWDGQIFSFVRKLIDENKSISKPIYSCPICMTPYYGTLIWFLFFRNSAFDVSSEGMVQIYNGVQNWFLTIGAATGMGVIAVILIHVNDYCKSRTFKDKEKCC